MNDTEVVGARNPARKLDHDRERAGKRQRALGQKLGQRLALQ